MSMNNEPSTSDTPRTDAAVYLTRGPNFNAVCPNFARQLERELAAVTRERDLALLERDAISGDVARLTRERDELRALLVETMLVAKAWHLVWNDKFAPQSNEEFLRIEREFLKLRKKKAAP